MLMLAATMICSLVAKAHPNAAVHSTYCVHAVIDIIAALHKAI